MPNEVGKEFKVVNFATSKILLLNVDVPTS
jgi:hypothetical protein